MVYIVCCRSSAQLAMYVSAAWSPLGMFELWLWGIGCFVLSLV